MYNPFCAYVNLTLLKGHLNILILLWNKNMSSVFALSDSGTHFIFLIYY